jgi:hypothetical protein
MMGSGETNSSGGVGNSIALFNNATDGSVLYVYAYKVDCSDFTQVYAQVTPGTVGTLWSNGTPVNPTLALGPGQIFTGNTPAGFNFTHTSLTWQGDQPTPWVSMGFPLAIAPPAYEVVIYDGLANEAILASFYWVPMQVQ